MGRNLHVVNFTFTLVDEPQATSVAGYHTLATLEMFEDYDELSASLQDIADEVNDLSQLKPDGEFYQLQYFLGGDCKFFTLVCGLNAANSGYSCIWCKCNSKDHWNMELKWPLIDTTKGARTIDEIQTLSKKGFNNCGPLSFT